MKIAVLMLVHKNEEQIKRLLAHFDYPDCEIFVHIDKKSEINNLSPEQIRKNVHIIKQRYDIVLYSFEMIRATLALVQEANNFGEFDYYMLVSGQDYLLRPFPLIVKDLKMSYPTSYIDVTPLHKGNWVEKSFSRSNCFKTIRGKNNAKASRISNKALRLLYKCFTVLPFKLISYFLTSPYHVLSRRSLSMYGGSQWWILSKPDMDSILRFYETSDLSVRKTLERVGSPDETFFQTCLMNTERGTQIKQNSWDQTQQSSMTYTSFEKTGHPIILRKENFDAMTASKKWIARKFDAKVDSKILDMIDENLRNVVHTENNNETVDRARE